MTTDDDKSNFEAILAEIGPFGRFQKTAMVFLWVPVIYCGMAFMTYSFVVGTPKDYRYRCTTRRNPLIGTHFFRCRIPACDQDTLVADLDPPWANAFIPRDGKKGHVHSCVLLLASENGERSRCTVASVLPSDPSQCSTSTPPATWSEDAAVECDEWVYSNDTYGETVTTEFGLVCNRWREREDIGLPTMCKLSLVSGVN